MRKIHAAEVKNEEIATILCRIEAQLLYIEENVNDVCEKHIFYIAKSLDYLTKGINPALQKIERGREKLGKVWVTRKADYYTVVYDPDAKWILIAEDECSKSPSELFAKNKTIIRNELLVIRKAVVKTREEHLHFFWDFVKLKSVCERLVKIYRSIGKTMVSVIEGHMGFSKKKTYVEPKLCTSCHRTKPKPRKICKVTSCAKCGILNYRNKKD